MVKDKPKQKETAEEHEDTSEFYSDTPIQLGEMTRRSGSGRYAKIVSGIALKTKKGSYEVKLNKLNLPLKSVYPSMEKCLQALAKINGADFSTTNETKRQIKGEEKTIVSYPRYIEWKNTVGMRVRTEDKKLYIEKMTDTPLKPLILEED